jgi:BirA family biotin operon repressor/biotin-[acetyl-CoA-carboxylase] ligase
VTPPLHVLEEATSTQDVARAWVREGRPHGEAVRARRQTAGRGRLGRAWEHAADDALALTVLLRPSLPPERLGWLAIAAAVALRDVAGPAFRIKWPNDLLAPDGRKVAGVLAEAEVQGRAVSAVLLGVGVNVRAAPPLPTATCTWAWGDRRDVQTWGEALRAALLDRVASVSVDTAEVAAAWEAGCAHLGVAVSVGEGASRVAGVALGLAEDGGLRVQTDAGPRVARAGDVAMVSAHDQG